MQPGWTAPPPAVQTAPQQPRFFQNQPDERAWGPGKPLEQESWLFRPWSFGGAIGFVQGGPLIEDWVGQDAGVIAQLSLGWDFDCYWGCATRFSLVNSEVYDTLHAREVARFVGQTLPPGPLPRRENQMYMWDIVLL
jgi:hypothetical protein